jgi:ketosteroid isomerase-like protein
VTTSNEALIERFYAAFAERNGAAMAACYAPEASFSDPVFPDLHGDEAGAMWRMLTERATDLRIELLEREAGDERGSARWRAQYTFTQTAASFRSSPGPRRTGAVPG